MDPQSTLTGSQAVWGGLGDLLVQTVNILFNLIVLTFRVSWTSLFTALFQPPA